MLMRSMAILGNMRANAWKLYDDPFQTIAAMTSSSSVLVRRRPSKYNAKDHARFDMILFQYDLGIHRKT